MVRVIDEVICCVRVPWRKHVGVVSDTIDLCDVSDVCDTGLFCRVMRI